MIEVFKLSLPANLQLVDPIGYLELLELITNSKGVITDSGTIVEEAAVLGVPSIQMRRSTERPQVYTCGASIKFDPRHLREVDQKIEKLLRMNGVKWEHPFGDGKASIRIVEDLVKRFENNTFAGHQREKYEPFSSYSYSSEST
jgi:UDP-N-acetylglucosamine 2-epimerase (non-hydrolysing)